MEIRRAVPEDAIGICRLEAECFSDPWSEREVFPYICSDDGMAFSVVENGEVIAYLVGRVIAPEGEIYRIAVKKEKRGRAIGYRLLSFAMKTERGRGLETVFLEVRAGNEPAIRLYSSYGFKKMGVRKSYYKNPTEDAVLMVLGFKNEFDN